MRTKICNPFFVRVILVCFRIILDASPPTLIELIKLLEKYQKIKIKKNYVNDIPKGDIKKTFSNNNKIRKLIKWEPNISLKDGVKKFIYWFDEYYKSY